jgi:hypothetical protein
MKKNITGKPSLRRARKASQGPIGLGLERLRGGDLDHLHIGACNRSALWI